VRKAAEAHEKKGVCFSRFSRADSLRQVLQAEDEVSEFLGKCQKARSVGKEVGRIPVRIYRLYFV
jgi:hypothetical protein